jgi:hypothetical protein
MNWLKMWMRGPFAAAKPAVNCSMFESSEKTGEYAPASSKPMTTNT